MPKISSIPEESMTIKPVQNSAPLTTILTLEHIEHVCIWPPGEVTTIAVLIHETGIRCCSANDLEMKE